MRPLCPWREAEVGDLRPEAPGRRDGEDVGFLSPGNCPGCEQEEAAAHPGSPHPGVYCLNSVVLLTVWLTLEASQKLYQREGTSVLFSTQPVLTPSAVNKIKQLLKDKPEHVGVKVGVRTRGCNGLSYTLEYTKTKGDSDEEVIQDELHFLHVANWKNE
nr:iron-sulfur cluster assembly 1 homolog, mitochondrial isoform X3 [Pongo abelii]